MRKFAFIVHPLRFEDFQRKYPVTKYLPPKWVEWGFKQVNPMVVGHVTGVTSKTDEELEGWLIALPLTPEILLNAPYEWVLKKLLRAGHLAENLGAEILGLGAFTKIAGDRGVTLARHLSIPVTTGNSYTTATAVEVTLKAARQMNIEIPKARATVIGATGSIGRASTFLLASHVQDMTLVARSREKLELLKQEVAEQYPNVEVHISTDIRSAVRQADIVVAVSSATGAIVNPEDLKPQSIVTDVARPRNLSRVVNEKRQDVLVLDGGVIEVPGVAADMGFDFGFPPRMVEACMAETMILALSNRLESFTLGPTIDIAKVSEIHRLGQIHGFKVAGFRRFERAIDDREIERIRREPDSAMTEIAASKER